MTGRGKFDPSEHHRAEIEARTAQGETCDQIAAALQAQGVPISAKTISRRRLQFGMRVRPRHKLAGTHLAVPRPSKQHGLSAGQSARRAAIEVRTRRGEGAEAIAAALLAQGHRLSSGASTVLRLQTFWGLIPPDPARARGSKKKKKKDGERKKKKPRGFQQEEVVVVEHYPGNCEFGPGGREGEPEILPPDENDGYATFPATTTTEHHQSPSIAAEIMSVEILVDLAHSTLGASVHLKDLLCAFQAGQSASGRGLPPPTLEEIAGARRKVREAAAVMHDLATEEGEVMSSS